MRKEIIYSRFTGGIADYEKEGLIPNSFAWSRCIDVRSDPKSIKLLPRTVKESGSVIKDLPLWSDVVSGKVYAYGDSGHFYERSTSASWSDLRTIPTSHGNGMAYYPDDDSIYYTSDTLIGRYGRMTGTPTFTDDYLGSIGGTIQNTYSLLLASASSQYAYHADSATLSLTGDTTVECNIKPTTLPATGASMTLVSKWDESGATRSFKFDILGVSAFFGDGSDGALTISSNTTDAPIDSACTGSKDSFSLTATNASFAAGQVILIHQTQGTGAGTYQKNKIQGYTAGTITLEVALNADYVSGAQVIVGKQYTNVTVNSGKTWTAKAWNGTTGGILFFCANGTVTVTGTISAIGKGFRAPSGTGNNSNNYGNGSYTGEGTAGPSLLVPDSTTTSIRNGSGGASGCANKNPPGGGGNVTQGGGTLGGLAVSTVDLSTMNLGGASGAMGGDTGFEGNGVSGGGIVFIIGTDLTVAGSIKADGSAATAKGKSSGAGGGVLIKCQTAALGTGLVTASPGTGVYLGGDGGVHVDYYTSVTGTTLPTLNSAQDNTLVTTTTYQLRFSVSNDGTAVDTMAQVADIQTGVWQHIAASWDASAHQTEFFFNGLSIGTRVGTMTAIHDNASAFYVGAHKGASAVGNFFDGGIDDVRLWNITRSANEILYYKEYWLPGTEPGLIGYWHFNNVYTDECAGASTLTASGSPTFVTDVPFTAASARFDVDQEDVTSYTNHYHLPTALTEGAANMKTFVPSYDPQKSIDVKVVAPGTGAWTIVIHDANNNEITSKTLAASSIPASGYVEFTFPSVWFPIVGATYHFHLYSSVNDAQVQTNISDDLSTVNFHTYFGYLLNNSYHPISKFLNMIVIGNGRYVATWDNITYNPNKLKLPGDYIVKCFALYNEYLAIGCYNEQFEWGRIFFWDGVSDQYNFFIDVPEGGINAMLGTKGIVEIIAGTHCDQLRYQGGDSAIKVRRLPRIKNEDWVSVNPGSMTMYQGILHFGTDGVLSTTAESGVYSYGTRNVNYPECLTFDHVVSTGNTNNNVNIGCLRIINNKLLIGYQDNVSYAFDVVDPDGSVYPSGTIEFLIYDDDRVYKDKNLMIEKVQCLSLVTGQTLTLKRKMDRGDWKTDISMTSGTENKEQIADGRFNEVQLGLDLATTVSTSPQVLAIVGQLEDNKEEEMI